MLSGIGAPLDAAHAQSHFRLIGAFFIDTTIAFDPLNPLRPLQPAPCPPSSKLKRERVDLTRVPLQQSIGHADTNGVRRPINNLLRPHFLSSYLRVRSSNPLRRLQPAPCPPLISIRRGRVELPRVFLQRSIGHVITHGVRRPINTTSFGLASAPAVAPSVPTRTFPPQHGTFRLYPRGIEYTS